MSNYYCRLCLTKCKPEDSSLFSKQITEMIEYCIPEFEIMLVNNPIICVTCHNLLKQTEAFKRSCLDVQESIKKRMSINETSNGNLNLINIDADITATDSGCLKNTLTTSFSESYKKFLLSNVANSSNNSLEEGIVSKITNDTSVVIAETNCDPDEFLNLLESSSNIKMEKVPDILVKSGSNSFSNFYDDEPHNPDKLESTSDKTTRDLPLKTRSVSKQATSLKAINNPLDVLFEKLCCISCELRLNTFASLITHLYTVHHKLGDFYTCIICRYKTQDYKCIKKHYQKVHVNCIDLKGSCLFCIRDMQNYAALYKHMRKEHPKCCTTDRFRCNSCDFTSRKFDIFRRHFFKSHDMICNYCLKSFESFEHLNRHLGGHARASKLNSINKTDSNVCG